MSTPPPPPPPPPNEPFPPLGDDPFGNGDAGDNGLSQGTPNVAAHPGRVVMVLGIIGALLLFLLYNIFFKAEEKPVEEAKPRESRRRAHRAATASSGRAERHRCTATFLPIDIPKPADVGIIRPEDDGAAQEERQARMRSKMFVQDNNGGGMGGLLGGGSSAPATAAMNDSNSQFAASVANANTKADRVEATRIGDLRRTIAQGRLIQATMESALNTELPAPIRAIVSRDTFGEAGTEALIPKGSRLIGTYNTDITGGQSRVFVVWTRVIRPDGVDIMINSPLVDQIGQAGIGGQVDAKFQQTFSRAVMASVISIAFAIASDEISGGGDTSTTNSTFGTTQSGDGATTATVNALNRLGSTTDNFLQKFVGVTPTILVDQGTPVNVFVNRDLVFPATRPAHA